MGCRVIPSVNLLGGDRHCESNVAFQEHSAMSAARVRTRTARSGGECTNHEASQPPYLYTFIYDNFLVPASAVYQSINSKKEGIEYYNQSSNYGFG